MKTQKEHDTDAWLSFMSRFGPMNLGPIISMIGKQIVVTNGRHIIVGKITGLGDANDEWLPSIEISAKMFRGDTIEQLLYLGDGNWGMTVRARRSDDPGSLIKGFRIIPLE